MNKILIFGAGNQAQKYISFFGKYGAIIEVVTYSGRLRKGSNNITTIYSFSSIQELGNEFFSQFQYIIIAVSPIEQQDRVLQLLLNLDVKIPTIIEKPVTYNYDILDAILLKDSYLFFIDELVLSKFFNSIDIGTISITAEQDRAILEHSLGAFLLCPNFKNILNQISFKYIPQLQHTDTMSYHIQINNGIELVCDGGKYYFGNKFIGEHFFDVNLKFLLTQGFSGKIDAHTFRSNYRELVHFLNTINFPQL